jgi:hypothetical protein
MILDLDRNAHGRPILTVPRAKALSATSASTGGWYVAPFAMGWAVGIKCGRERYHLLDERGEPIRFDFVVDAQQYLQRELKVTETEFAP